jgi:7-carboxy-7-deazaguanine synthase
MPRRRTLKTIEVFSSIQGEGLRQGEPTIFVRLAGCNLRCSFCDTKRAWGEGTERTVDDLLAEVRRLRDGSPAAWVSITGGEPLVQDISPLVRKLHGDGFRVQVETNGTRPPAAEVDWFSVSPKPPDYDYHPGFVGEAREVKLVVCRSLSFEAVRSVRKAFPAAVPVLLQVRSNASWSMKKASKLLRQASLAGLENLRISIQLHKIFGLR